MCPEGKSVRPEGQICQYPSAHVPCSGSSRMTTWTSTVGDPPPPEGGEVTPNLKTATVILAQGRRIETFHGQVLD